MKKILGIATLAALQACFTPAAAQSADSWPNRPVRIIHGFAPAGPIDNFARLLAAQFNDRFGEPAIVEGKPGAGGTIAARFVARSPSDGYILYLMASGHASAPGLYKSLGYDPVKDFTMISIVAQSPYAVIANPVAGYGSMRELIDAARLQPEKIDYGSGGIGSGMHLAATLLQARTGVRLNHVAYKGGGAPALAVIGGEVPVIMTALAGMSTYIAEGKVKPLAETVAPGFDVTAWYALAGPKDLPPAIVAKLNDMVRETLQRKDIIESLRLQAAEPSTSSPDEAQALLASEVARWQKVVREEGLSNMN
jgi:tripartite-type tricarboxylate transporter receptor subunit TctC